jgi:hypothetical protein
VIADLLARFPRGGLPGTGIGSGVRGRGPSAFGFVSRG